MQPLPYITSDRVFNFTHGIAALGIHLSGTWSRAALQMIGLDCIVCSGIHDILMVDLSLTK